jgi:uncharacterized protein YehS (DUF1456 family)
MTNNDVLRRIRYTFDLDDSKVIAIFGLGDWQVDRAQISDWLKQDSDEAFAPLSDAGLAAFMNGLIIDRRGKREGVAPVAEKRLNNNQIFLKLKIALELQAEAVLDLMSQGGLKVSKHELSAFFRKPGHKHYRECKDQALRAFLKGLQIQYRGEEISE